MAPTHTLIISILGTVITRTWIRLSDGLEETDVTVLAALEDTLDCDVPPTFGQQYGAGLAVLPVTSPVKTITLSVYAGTVAVTTANGTGFEARAGSTFSWGDDDANGLDITDLTFTGGAGSDFVLHGEK